MIEGIEDLEYIMRWERNESVKPGNQKQLFVELTRQEQVLFDLIKDKPKESVDNVSLNARPTVSQTSTLLLEMEFKGVVKSLPGKIYVIG